MAGLDDPIDWSKVKGFEPNYWSIEQTAVIDETGVTSCFVLRLADLESGQATSLLLHPKSCAYLGFELMGCYIHE